MKKSIIENKRLKMRIEFLEKSNRSIANALKQAMALSRNLTQIKINQKSSVIIEETAFHINRLKLFDTFAFYLVDQRNYDFSLAFCKPENQSDLLLDEIEYQISDNNFSWALKQNSAVTIDANKFKNKKIILHSVLTKSSDIGMFIGVLTAKTYETDRISSDLLSIILNNCAQTIENSFLYTEITQQSQELKNTNEHLKQEIAEHHNTENELRKHRDHLEELVNERTTKLSETNKFLQKAKEDAENANQVKTKFLANMSHEIKTPINAIIWQINSLLNNNHDSHQATNLLSIKNDADYLFSIISNMLDLAKLEAKQFLLEKNPFNIHSVIMQVKDIFKKRLHDKYLSLILSIDENIPETMIGDSRRLKQILINLTDNAIKFTNEGTITIKAEFEQQHNKKSEIHFTVQDTGIGINDEQKQIIFQDFKQIDSSNSRQNSGTGLGLTISKLLISKMGGKIWVESNGEHGSTFHFIIPYITRSENNDKINNDCTLDEKLKLLNQIKDYSKILIVEDNLINQKIIEALIKKTEIPVDIAADGLLALEALKKNKYNLILMDIQMPNMDGIAATKMIRDELSDKETPIVAVTAHELIEDKKKCLEVGMNDYLTKPINADKFYYTLYKWLVINSKIKVHAFVDEFHSCD